MECSISRFSLLLNTQHSRLYCSVDLSGISQIQSQIPHSESEVMSNSVLHLSSHPSAYRLEAHLHDFQIWPSLVQIKEDFVFSHYYFQ